MSDIGLPAHGDTAMQLNGFLGNKLAYPPGQIFRSRNMLVANIGRGKK